MLRRPTISIIIPFFNAECTIAKCLCSILESDVGVSFEIICVNDGSTDEGNEIVLNYKKKYRNIRIYKHKTNKGLFQARLTALKHVRGKYIGFVDSDDYVKKGYFRELYESIINNNADIAVGRIINVASDNICYVQTRCKDFPYSIDSKDEKYYDMFWKQEGLCYPWHVVWNKLYVSKIWKANYTKLKKMDIHSTMMEDFIFSSVILSKSSQIVSVKNAYYYYVQNDTASTSHSLDYKKWESNITAMGEAFKTVEHFLEKDIDLSKYLVNLNNWKQRYSRYWTRNIKQSKFEEYEMNQLLNLLKESLCVKELFMPEPFDEYYYELAEYGIERS